MPPLSLPKPRPPRIWQPHYEAGEKTAGGSFCTCWCILWRSIKNQEDFHSQDAFLRVFTYIEVILKTVKNQGSHHCFFLCIPRSSRQDIYAMLDLDMPLSEAALRTEGRDQLVSDLTFSGPTWLILGMGNPYVFQCYQNFRLIIFVPIRRSCWQWNQFGKCTGLLHPTPVFPCSKMFLQILETN